MTESKDAPDVFISYKSEERDWTRAIDKALLDAASPPGGTTGFRPA